MVGDSLDGRQVVVAARREFGGQVAPFLRVGDELVQERFAHQVVGVAVWIVWSCWRVLLSYREQDQVNSDTKYLLVW